MKIEGTHMGDHKGMITTTIMITGIRMAAMATAMRLRISIEHSWWGYR